MAGSANGGVLEVVAVERRCKGIEGFACQQGRCEAKADLEWCAETGVGFARLRWH